jgi:hypothetical protein
MHYRTTMTGRSKFSVVRGILWFLLLLAVWMAVLLWSYLRAYGFSGPPKFDLAFALMLYLGPPIGAVFILILMFADVTSRCTTFPRNVVTFVTVAIGLDVVVLILSNFVNLSWVTRSLYVVSAIMIVRNITRSLMAWTHT